MFESLERAGYEKRKSQREMAQKIVELLEKGKGIYMLEAPTGTGKTFAYLIPAIASGKSVVVSTYTKVLQEQLLRDVETLSKIYGKKVRAGVWKGVSSYICKVRLEENPNPEIEEKAEKVGGDISRMDLSFEEVLDYTVEDLDECEGCTRKDCYYALARSHAFASEVMIVNHHVLANHMSLIQTRDLVIIDEGHEFPEVLVEAQAHEFSEKTIKEFTGREEVEEADLPEVLEELRLRLEEEKKVARGKVRFLLSGAEEIALSTLRGIRKYTGLEAKKEFPDLGVGHEYSPLDREIWKVLRRVRRLIKLIEKVEIYIDGRAGFERLVEKSGRWKRFRVVPLFADLKTFLTKATAPYGSLPPPVAFVSATLDRDYMEMMLCLEKEDYEYFSFPSEWEYGLDIKVLNVNPKEKEWEKALRYAVELAKSEYDRVIVLLTNKEHLSLIDTPLKQGRMGMKVLVERFEKEGGVLAGVDTFWKGIDVPGRKALVIGKLPFKNPDDPLHAKRSEFLKNYYGEKTMWKYVKAVAKMDLKQGLGRLKRRREDTGVVYLVDNRVFRPFFSDFLKALNFYGKVSLLTLETKTAIS